MKKKMSTREIVLLGLLLLLLVFYFVNKGPIERITESLETEKNQLEGDMLMIEPYTNQMNLWQKELDAVYEKYGDEAKSIPDYNNINTIMTEMSSIFDGDSTYSISFASPELEDHIVKRNISISFSCKNYNDAISKLKRINNSDNRYRITNLSLSGTVDRGYNAAINVVAYEYTEETEI